MFTLWNAKANSRSNMLLSNYPHMRARSTPGSHFTNAIIQSITCPITQEVMHEPMQAPDGHTYEKTAILEWLGRNPISPQTRQPMQVNQLKVNATLRFLCDEYHKGTLGTVQQVRTPPKISSNSIKLIHKLNTNMNKDKFMLTFQIEDSTFPQTDCGHLSQDIVLAIDRSGSMNVSVEAKDGQGNQLENGFSIQDIVNHAAKTTIKTLDNNSRCAIIVFDNEIEVVFELTIMNEVNKAQCLAVISEIKPRGQTNIWGAIDKAIKILDERVDKTRNGQILLFTDGSPNISPARGEVETLKKLREKKNFTAPIYTFGFGYNLKKELLYDMAKYANGGNGHIPDGNMIATVFCNFISTMLCTVAVNLQLHIMTAGVTIKGDYASYKNSDNNVTIYDLGTVQYQQSRNIIFESREKQVKYFFTYKIGGASYTSDHYTIDIDNKINWDVNTNEVNAHALRSELVENLRNMINYNNCGDFKTTQKLIDEMDSKLRAEISTQTPLVMGMLENLSGNESEGQISLAVLNKEYYKRWGELYLDQLSRSLNQQIKPNFKDAACIFGGTVFNNIVDKASDIFDSLPPPTPSNLILNRISSSSGSYRGIGLPPVPPTAPMTSLSDYNDPGGGCYTGDTLISMSDGRQKPVSLIRKGDKVITLSDPFNGCVQPDEATVICVVKTVYNNPINLVDLGGGLKITPWHPIYIDNDWVFPNSIQCPILTPIKEVYTLVLDKYHIAFADDIACICLGHNFKTDTILNHPYFGTDKVINDLKKLDNWDNGEVIIDSSKYTRDNTNANLINGLTI